MEAIAEVEAPEKPSRKGMIGAPKGTIPPNAGGGRPKGIPNKTTRTFREAIVDVYDKLQKGAGGNNAHFLNWASQNPTEFYKIATRLIPVQLQGSLELNNGASETAIGALVEELRELRRLRAAEPGKIVENAPLEANSGMKEAKRIATRVRNGRDG